MLDLNKVEIELIEIETSIKPDVFMEYMNTPFKTVIFNNASRDDIDVFFKELEFEPSVRENFYFKRIEDLILVVYIEDLHVKDKFFIQWSETNTEYIKEADSYFNSFEDFHSDAARNYTLYPKNIDKMFYEHYVVRLDDRTLLRAECAFKYENNRFVFASIFPKDEQRIDIAYDDYSLNPNCILPYVIFFRENKVKNLIFLNKLNNKKFSLSDHTDVFPTEHITLENYHLFWEHFSSEQKILFEMLSI